MANRVLPTSFRLTVETPGPVDGELIWMRVVGIGGTEEPKTYLLKPGGDPFGGDDQWEESHND